MGFNIFAMPDSSILLLFSVALGVSNALPWAGPQPTNGYQADAWSPVPTGVPADPAKLFRRSSVNVDVCGWIGGNSAQPVACGSGSSCVYDTIHGYVGCCTTSGACKAGVYTSCVDAQSSDWNKNSGIINDGIYTWYLATKSAHLEIKANTYQYGQCRMLSKHLPRRLLSVCLWCDVGSDINCYIILRTAFGRVPSTSLHRSTLHTHIRPPFNKHRPFN
jgi:hypothetical protein